MIPEGLYDHKLVDTYTQELCRNLRTAQNDRKPLEDRWLRYLQAYKAFPKEDIKQFPWPGASNLVIPEIGTQTDKIYSRIMAMLFTPDSVWSTTAIRPDMVDFAPKLQEFLTWAQTHELNVYNEVADWVLELCKIGTSILKVRYNRQWQKLIDYREAQTMDNNDIRAQSGTRWMMTNNSPVLEHIPIWDIYLPSNAIDIQSASWLAHRFRLSYSEYYKRVTQGIYRQLPYLTPGMFIQQQNDITRAREDLDRFKTSRSDDYEFIEFWCSMDVDGDGAEEAIVLTVDLQTQEYTRIDFNSFPFQERPFEAARFMRQEKRFYGIGIAEMLLPFQEEISTMHNQRIDNGSIVNMPLFKTLATSKIRTNEPLFPGRVLRLNTMDEFAAVQQATPMESTVDDEKMSQNYAVERTGGNDYVFGGDQPSIGYSAAAVAAQQLREGAKRFDQTLREIRKALSKQGLRIVELYQQFNQGGKAFVVQGPEDGSITTAILQFPLQFARFGISIDVTATSASYNKEMELRANMLILGDVMKYYNQLMQYVQIALNPQVPPQFKQLAKDAAIGMAVVVKRIVELHGLQDIKRVITDPEVYFNAGPPVIAPGAPPMGAGSIPNAGNAMVPQLSAGNGQADSTDMPIG